MSSRVFRVACGLSLVVLAGCAGLIGLGDYTVHDGDGIDAAVADAPPAALDVMMQRPDPPDVVTKPFTCPDGQVVSVDRCFFLNPTPLDQQNAKAACFEAGAHLAVIRTAEENGRVAAIGEELDAARWIGLEGPPQGAMSDRSKYLWVDRTPVDYTNWRDGDPNMDSSCVVYYQGALEATELGAQETWADRACADLYPSICSQP